MARKKKALRIIDPSRPLKYVMYLRKSSEGEDAQAKSLPDQKESCLTYARFHNLKIETIIEESASAWTSGNRPKFQEMIKDVKAGKIDGILAYHPDRLSRNMLEGGKIIDMLDNQELLDLKFPTFEFVNDGNGKLLLGILFTMSKNYTDHQSEVVQRGVTSNFEQGKSNGADKWGYSRDPVTGYYRPNEFFDIVREGWIMRSEGSTYKEILKFWKENDVHRTTKVTRRNKKIRKIRLDSNTQATTLFRDPFYYGILVQSGEEKDLRKEYGANFKPMINEDIYNSIQALSDKKNRKIKKVKNPLGDVFYPLRGIVTCAECGSNMYIGPSKSKSGKRYLYVRCDNKDCPVKSIRAKNIFEPLYEILDKLVFTEEDYKAYSRYIRYNNEERVTSLKIERRSLQGALNSLNAKITQLNQDYLRLDVDASQETRKYLTDQIDSLAIERDKKTARIDEIKKILVDSDKIKLSKEDFLNTTKNLAEQMRNGDARQKDILCRILFLNTEIGLQKTPSFIWREPFDQIVELSEIMSGTRERT